MKSIDQVPKFVGYLVSALMVLGGLVLGFQMLPTFFGTPTSDSLVLSAVSNVPSTPLHLEPANSTIYQSNPDKAVAERLTEQEPGDLTTIEATVSLPEESSLSPTENETIFKVSSPEASANPRPDEATVGSQPEDHQISQSIQIIYTAVPPPLLQEWIASQPNLTLIGEPSADLTLPTVRIGVNRQNGIPIFKQTFAVATRFNTLETELSLAQIQAIWQNSVDSLPVDMQPPFAQIVILQEDVPGLTALLGSPSGSVEFSTSMERLQEAAKSSSPTLVLVPFERLIPSWTVLAVNGENPVENGNTFTDTRYPLKATFFLRWENFTGQEQTVLDALLSDLPRSNRDPQKLTVIAMTGVTAMVRGTAAQMDRFGSSWPAEIVGPELASADITHISNEVPFVEGCQTENSSATLIFCSKLSYMETLLATGVDIIGLTGNHQNDYGREDALASLNFYAEHELPVYGGGIDQEEANRPLYVTHNGNRLAFLGANSYGPNFAWATENRPGSARFDLNIMSANIRAVKEQDLADIVLAELQYQETYEVTPLIEQRIDFNALVRAGADIVTGVQSHVPQAIEFTDGKLILYGLGNLFFDQMWSQPVREGLIVKHTIYEGRHISTQILTTMLHEFGQPHWTTPTERELLLNRVFQASYWE